jgi:hypothetical protein
MLTIGYHGCPREIGMRAILKQEGLEPQNKAYHWLGDGIYFWENDPHRALEWAQEKASRDEVKEPFVIGAIIDLGRCLDINLRENQTPLISSFDSLKVEFESAGRPFLKNKKAKGDDREINVLRFLDCAVINRLNQSLAQPFDTVRGLFVEGEPIFEGAEIYHKTHSEIAVRNQRCIKGYFLPDLESLGLALGT